MTTKSHTRRDAALNAIARDVLSLDTLETRNRDALDFHDLGVASIRAALEQAFAAGQQAALTAMLREGHAALVSAAAALLEARDNQMVTKVEWHSLRTALNRARRPH